MSLDDGIVLIGGGHAHVQVLTAFRDAPPGVPVTLVSESVDTPYSGMLPGCVAGLYTRGDIHIDLAELTRSCGIAFVVGRACALDRERRRVVLEDGREVPYGLVSLDVGIKPDLSAIEGGEDYALPVKPISGFLARFERLLADALTSEGPRRIAVVGAGPAGVEIALAIRARIRRDAPGRGLDAGRFSITLVSSGPPVQRLNEGARRRVMRALASRGIEVCTGRRVTALDASGALLSDGSRLDCDAAIVATHARPAGWLAHSSLPTTPDGSLALTPTLQALDDDRLFGAGDCATVVDHPREKAGVFAVRQGPLLARNLRARLEGRQLESPVPQTDFLTLLATGDGEAIGARGRWLAFSGRWVFAWKDRIDRGFMARFRV